MDNQNDMTQEELKLYNEILADIKECPNCKNNTHVKEFIMGRPSPLLISLSKKTNKISLGGCCMREEFKRFKCSECNTKFS